MSAQRAIVSTVGGVNFDLNNLPSNNADIVDVANQQTIFNIQDSRNIVLGNVTNYHCPVTMIQESATTDVGEEHCKINNLESIMENNLESAKLLSCLEFVKQFKTRWKILYITGFVIIALVAGIVVVEIQDRSALQVLKRNYTDEVISLNCSEVIPRRLWGARPPLKTRLLKTPVDYVIVAHTVSNKTCNSVPECLAQMKLLQSYTVEQGYPDIGYNFLIGSDGNIYVGRGWDLVNYLQNHSIAVAFIGNFAYDEFTDKMQYALEELTKFGIQQGKLSENYILLSHSQTWNTRSPGKNILDVISKWPNYYDKNFITIPDYVDELSM